MTCYSPLNYNLVNWTCIKELRDYVLKHEWISDKKGNIDLIHWNARTPVKEPTLAQMQKFLKKGQCPELEKLISNQ